MVVELLDQVGDFGVDGGQTLGHTLPRRIILAPGQSEQELGLEPHTGQSVARIVSMVLCHRGVGAWSGSGGGHRRSLTRLRDGPC